ncbi:DUF6520 family protein [Flavobacterium rhizosphaerae]|uniref:DUF6520 family protein n=1 Tax=Flavobacterium rhizosphaerae TaxID=3163298 RepID=A0ABW8YZ70_9FLAO
MKTLRGFLLPAVVITAGVGAAFATSKPVNTAAVPMQGYYFNNAAPTVKCIATSVQCETSGTQLCTWKDANNVSHNLQQKVNDATCGLSLYRIN